MKVDMPTRSLGEIEVFEYPGDPQEEGSPAWGEFADWGAAESVPPLAVPASGTGSEERPAADFEQQRIAEEKRCAFEAGQEKGRQEGRILEREAQAAALSIAEQRRVRQVTELIERFGQERDRYMLAVEQEVVSLALGIARRILRREAQMDPLLLTGAVRVALGQLAASTQVRLRVPAEELGLWTEAFSLMPKLAIKPQVLAGEAMQLGECRLETELGTVDLGLRAQLGEIERGFFDRAGECRTGPARESAAVAGPEMGQ